VNGAPEVNDDIDEVIRETISSSELRLRDGVTAGGRTCVLSDAWKAYCRFYNMSKEEKVVNVHGLAAVTAGL
jgi:hypothetical protein